MMRKTDRQTHTHKWKREKTDILYQREKYTLMFVHSVSMCVFSHTDIQCHIAHTEVRRPLGCQSSPSILTQGPLCAVAYHKLAGQGTSVEGSSCLLRTCHCSAAVTDKHYHINFMWILGIHTPVPNLVQQEP